MNQVWLNIILVSFRGTMNSWKYDVVISPSPRESLKESGDGSSSKFPLTSAKEAKMRTKEDRLNSNIYSLKQK